ncbi:hypothetical protein [Nesterenkonia muleiensis]|nr:hypothetical protein [Nesterenkonia muleiensis]
MILRSEEVNPKYFSFEAASVRHEHEYIVWDQVKPPVLTCRAHPA